MDYWLCVSVGLCVSVFSRERHNVRMLRASLSETSSQLTQRYENVSVYFYDREYRKLQACHDFRWGTDIPHLHTMQLTPRITRPNGKYPPSARQTNRSGPVTPDGRPICKLFNSARGCGFTDCKFVHSCSYKGCGHSHSASTHMQPTQGQSNTHAR